MTGLLNGITLLDAARLDLVGKAFYWLAIVTGLEQHLRCLIDGVHRCCRLVAVLTRAVSLSDISHDESVECKIRVFMSLSSHAHICTLTPTARLVQLGSIPRSSPHARSSLRFIRPYRSGKGRPRWFQHDPRNVNGGTRH